MADRSNHAAARNGVRALPAKPPPGYKLAKSGLAVPIDVKAAQYNLYNTPRTTGQLDFYRQRWFTTGDIRKLVTEYDRWELMSYSRQLFSGLGNVSSAILQKNYRSVGESWRATYAGTHDRAWGDEVEEWLEHVWYPNCDLRGQPYDFVTDLVLSGIAWDVDGDDAMVLTEDEDSHFPKIQFIPAHRINTRMQAASNNNEIKIDGGWADGAMVSQGVIYDSNMKVIGLRILGDGETQDRDVPMTGAQLMYDPVWQSQNRGIPPMAVEIMGWLDYQDIDVFLKRGVKRASAIGLLRTTESGQADTGEGFISDSPLQDFSPGVKRELTRGGEDFYFTAGKGEKVEHLKYEMPTDNIEAFVKRLEHRGILACGWFAELLNPKEIGGASVRLIQDNARAAVRHRQKFIKMRAKRAVRYAVAKAMKYGWISQNNMDWWKWHFETPAQITVDGGHDATADLNMLKLGIMTEEKYHAKCGDSAKRVQVQKGGEIIRRITEAQQIAKDTALDFFWVYEQLWNPTAAMQSSGPQGDHGSGGGGGSENSQ